MKQKYLYSVTRIDDGEVHWDDTYQIVVCAESKEAALLINPNSNQDPFKLPWIEVKRTVIEIGVANPEIELNTIICHDYYKS